jgi:hypothetical protein
MIPLLQRRGVDRATLEGLMVENPRRILSVDPKRYPGAKQTLLSHVPVDPLAPYDYRMISSA